MENDEDLRTLFCGNLSEDITEELLYELFLQVAPVESVRIPKDKSGRQSNYGFVVLKHEISAQYAIQLLDGTCLFDRMISVKRKNTKNKPPGAIPIHETFPMPQEYNRHEHNRHHEPQDYNRHHEPPQDYNRHDRKPYHRHKYQRGAYQRNNDRRRWH